MEKVAKCENLNKLISKAKEIVEAWRRGVLSRLPIELGVLIYEIYRRSNLSYKEIAELLDLNYDTVRKLVSEARKFSGIESSSSYNLLRELRSIIEFNEVDMSKLIDEVTPEEIKTHVALLQKMFFNLSSINMDYLASVGKFAPIPHQWMFGKNAWNPPFPTFLKVYPRSYNDWRSSECEKLEIIIPKQIVEIFLGPNAEKYVPVCFEFIVYLPNGKVTKLIGNVGKRTTRGRVDAYRMYTTSKMLGITNRDELRELKEILLLFARPIPSFICEIIVDKKSV